MFVTGGAFTEGARAFLRSVSHPCLEKPIDVAALHGVLRRVRDDGERAAS